jgi:hypothetical protein
MKEIFFSSSHRIPFLVQVLIKDKYMYCNLQLHIVSTITVEMEKYLKTSLNRWIM